MAESCPDCVALDRRVDDRFVADEKRWLAQFEHLRREVDLAKSELERRLSSMNEFREELRRVQGTFVVREELELRAAASIIERRSLAEKIEKAEKDLSERMTERIGKLEKAVNQWWAIVTLIGGIAGIIGAVGGAIAQSIWK